MNSEQQLNTTITEGQIHEESPDANAVRAGFQAELAEHQVVIEQPREFPELAIDYTVFGDAGQRMEEKVRSLQHWLRKPYVTDRFGTSGENHLRLRVPWRKQMEQKYKSSLGEEVEGIFHGSKYSGNSRLEVRGAFEVIKRTLRRDPKFSELLNRITDIMTSGPDFTKEGDVPWTIEELRGKTEHLEDVVYNIIQAIYEFSQKIPNKTIEE